MNKTLTNMTHAVQRKAMGAMIDKVLKDLDKDREGEYLKLVESVIHDSWLWPGVFMYPTKYPRII